MLDRLKALFGRPAEPTYVRRFDAATGGRRGHGFGSFGPVNSEVGGAAPMVRSRARHLVANNPWIAQASANWTGALVGAGIVPTGRHTDPAIRAALGSHFMTWADDADDTGRTDFAGLCAEIARGLVIDGESFAQIVATDAGPRLRLIPPELIDESLTRDLGGGAFIVSGIEFNAEGQRIAYHVFPSRPTDQFASYAPPVRVSAEDMLHVMKPLAAGQVRGISWLAPVILPANEFDQITDALAMGVKVAAMHAGFLIDQNGTGGEPYETAGSIFETGLEPGTLKRLPAGIDVKFTTPQQASEVGAFLRFNLQMLAAGLGLPEHLLSGDLTGANYSSLRAGLLPFRQRVEQVQYSVFVPQLLRPVWRAVATHAVLSGAIDSDLSDAFRVDWIMPALLQVDPQKAVQADVAEIAAGLASRRQKVAERGWDVEALDAEIAADAAREASLGIAPRTTEAKP